MTHSTSNDANTPTAPENDAKRPLRERVTEAWQNALANGADFLTWTDREVALDMCYCASDLEDEKVTDVEAEVKIVRAMPQHE